MIELKLATGFVDIETDRLIKADWNYKTGDDEMLQKLRENIRTNGQIENIIIRELPDGRYEVVNGNHRYDVLVELGLATCHAYNLGVISDNQAKKVSIETNETRFATDNVKLAEIIDQLLGEYSAEELAVTMPFSEEELDHMQKSLTFDWSQFDDTDGSATGSGEPGEIVFTITVKEADSCIEQELEELCRRYESARLRTK